MKNQILAILLLIIVTVMTAFSMEKSSEPYLTKEFTLTEAGKLDVKTSGGYIEVFGIAGNTAKVEMYVDKASKNISSTEIEEILKDFKFKIEKEGNDIIVFSEKIKMNQPRVRISFVVYMPVNSTCLLNTSGGSIKVNNIKGKDHIIKTSGGSLDFSGLHGNLNAKTAGGSINIVNFNGLLDAQTSGGSIKLENAKGVLKVSTAGGSIRLTKISGDMNAHTSGGSIVADIEEFGKYLELKTSGGSITTTLPGNKGLDLDLKGDRIKTKLINFSGDSKQSAVKGSTNGGGIPVTMYTSGGSINLNFKN